MTSEESLIMDEGSKEIHTNIDDYVGNEFVPWEEVIQSTPWNELPFYEDENQDAIAEESNQVLQPEVSSDDALSSAPTTDMSAKQVQEDYKEC